MTATDSPSGLVSLVGAGPGDPELITVGGAARLAQADAVGYDRLATTVDTLIFLMGMAQLDDVTQRLIAHGRAAETPVAVIQWGTLPRQRTVSGTLATIAEMANSARIEAPAITVVGEVARLRDDLNWFDKRPLFGKRVLVTRTRRQASEVSRALKAAGAEAVELPTIEIVHK